MAGLQRSAQTFRRSGSSGLVWDERFLTEGAEEKPKGAVRRQPELRHSRSVGGVGMLLRRRGRDDNDAGDEDDKKRKLITKAMAQRDRQKQEEQEPAPGIKAFRTRDMAPVTEATAQKDRQKREDQETAPGMKAFRTRDVAPAAEPPSPRVSGCVLCAIFRGSVDQWRGSSSARRARPRNKR